MILDDYKEAESFGSLNHIPAEFRSIIKTL
jgi:hypothetical protein